MNDIADSQINTSNFIPAAATIITAAKITSTIGKQDTSMSSSIINQSMVAQSNIDNDKNANNTQMDKYYQINELPLKSSNKFAHFLLNTLEHTICNNRNNKRNHISNNNIINHHQQQHNSIASFFKSNSIVLVQRYYVHYETSL